MSGAGLKALEDGLARDLAYLNYPPDNWVRPSPGPDGRHVFDAVVIGAGMCGLTAAFALRRAGIANIRIVDDSEAGFEGPWVTYARMNTLRSPKHLTGPAMGLPALTCRAWFEAQFGAAAWEELDKIPRTMWMDYLRWYRHVLNLPVENGVTVRTIEPHGDLLGIKIDGASEPCLARKVVLANGRDGAGGLRIPPFAESLPASCWNHSKDDIDFNALVGKRVAVLGASASACDNAAVALETGAAEVHMFVRRPDLPRINKFKGVIYPGFTHGFPTLDDEWRWRLLHYALAHGVAPPQDSMLRLKCHDTFKLHLGSPWERVETVGDEVEIETPKGVHRFDHLILATGFTVNVDQRAELAGLTDKILVWGDRVDAPSDRTAQDLARFPYLGPAFEFLEKQPGTAPALRHIHCFNYAATLSHGVVSGDIPNVSEGAQRMVEGIARDFFAADRAYHFQQLQEYAEPELLGDEWVDADAVPEDAAAG